MTKHYPLRRNQFRLQDVRGVILIEEVLSGCEGVAAATGLNSQKEGAKL